MQQLHCGPPCARPLSSAAGARCRTLPRHARLAGRRPGRHVDCLHRAYRFDSPSAKEKDIMGRYLIAWLLGVPAFVLVLFWLFF